MDALADHLVEGTIVQSKALNDLKVIGAQVRLFRSDVRLIFGA